MSNLGKWNRWYADLEEPQPYGSTETYRIGADFLDDCNQIEDWGCGKGFMRTLIDPDRYRGVDGSSSVFVDEVADLAHYRSEVDAVFMRHVIEHDWRWEAILDNAVRSAQRKLVLVLFTPLAESTYEIAWNPDPGVPDISFRLEDVTRMIDWKFDIETVEMNTATQYGVETVLLCEARPDV